MMFVAVLAGFATFVLSAVVLGVIQGLASTKMGHAGNLMMEVQPYRNITNWVRFGLSLCAAGVAFVWVMG